MRRKDAMLMYPDMLVLLWINARISTLIYQNNFCQNVRYSIFACYLKQKLNLKTMKKFFFVVALAAATFSVKAQDEEGKTLRFSLGAEVALPIGKLADVSGVGIGGSVQGEYMVDTDLGITLSAGYLHFSGKDYDVPGEGSGLIPVLAGIRYHFTPNVYASGQLGMTFGTEKGAGSIFTYAPGLGYQFSQNFDAQLRYIGWSKDSNSTSAIGLRLAYTF